MTKLLFVFCFVCTEDVRRCDANVLQIKRKAYFGDMEKYSIVLGQFPVVSGVLAESEIQYGFLLKT